MIELLSYIINLDEENRTIKDFLTAIHDQVPVNVENQIMSLAERLIEEGELKGKLETAQNMLIEGADPVFVAKVTKLKLDVIKALQIKNK